MIKATPYALKGEILMPGPAGESQEIFLRKALHAFIPLLPVNLALPLLSVVSAHL